MNYRRTVIGAIRVSSLSPRTVPFAPVCETVADLATVTAEAGWCSSTLSRAVISCVASFRGRFSATNRRAISQNLSSSSTWPNIYSGFYSRSPPPSRSSQMRDVCLIDKHFKAHPKPRHLCTTTLKFRGFPLTFYDDSFYRNAFIINKSGTYKLDTNVIANLLRIKNKSYHDSCYDINAYVPSHMHYLTY